MTVSTERELAHARDVTITECQERLREIGRGLLETAAGEISARFARHMHDAAEGLETLRTPADVSSEYRSRLQQAGELAYRITTTAGDSRYADRWATLVSDLWNVLRGYDLPGKEGE